MGGTDGNGVNQCRMDDDDTVTTREERRGDGAAAVVVDCPRLRLPGGRRVCSAARAQRERSASAARAQRASASARGRQYPKASRARRRARSRRCRSRSLRDAGPPTDRARCARAGTPRAASPRRDNSQASPACARSRVRSCMQAHAERGARDGEARRRRPSACGRPPAKHARMARHKGRREIHHHPTSLHAGAYVRAQHAATGAGGPPRATELASSEQARLVRSGPSRELRGIAPGGREGRSAVTSPPSITLDCA